MILKELCEENAILYDRNHNWLTYMSEHSEFTPKQVPENEPYVVETRLLRKPTPELVEMEKKIRGLFTFRGSICEFFPQNTVATFLMLRLWNEYIQNHNLPQQFVDEVIPPLYTKAICVLPKIKVVYYDKVSKTYEPYQENGQQLELENVLYRQGYNEPFALVAQGPYAGLLLSTTKDAPITGSKPQDVESLVIQRLMNDGTLDNPHRIGKYHAKLSTLLTPIDSVEKAEIQEFILELPENVERTYHRYARKTAANGEPLNAVAHIQKFCQELGFPYDENEVNYQLV